MLANGDRPRLRFLSAIPRSILAFSLFHIFFGVSFGWRVLTAECVDPPPPAGAYLLDGCSSYIDPLRDGYAPYYLAIFITIIASSVGLLRASRLARIVLPMAITAFFAYGFWVLLQKVKEHLDLVNDSPHGWIAAWDQLTRGMSIYIWMVPIGWILFDGWFLFASRARMHFSGSQGEAAASAG